MIWPSVCLPVARCCYTKMAKCRITYIVLRDSPGTLVFWYQRTWWTLIGVAKKVGYVEIGGFRPLSHYISETVQQRDSYYGRLIGTCMHCIEWWYFRWPYVTLTTQDYPVFYIFIVFHVFVTSGDTGFKCGRSLVLAYQSQTTHERGVVGVTWHIFKFWGPQSYLWNGWS